MSVMKRIALAAAFSAIAAGGALAQQQQQPKPPLGFFVATDVPGTGNLGGLAGADQICQNIAATVGAGNRTWRAYLSTQAANGQPAVNARDRIGNGPWANVNGVIIAANVDDLHGDKERDRNYILKFTALDANGNEIKGVGDDVVQHDMLTGSDSHGMAFPPGNDMTCGNWTSDVDTDGSRPVVGHTDRRGLPDRGNTSWNFAHQARGCSKEGLIAFGGAGYFYCFAADVPPSP